MLFTSPPLGNYSFDRFVGYSPPVTMRADGLSVPNDGLVLVVLEVHNNQRNLQIPVDDLAGGFNATVTWKKKAARDEVDAIKEGHAGAGHDHDEWHHQRAKAFLAKLEGSLSASDPTVR